VSDSSCILPSTLRQITEIIGEQETAQLAAALGGSRLKFPDSNTLPRSHPVIGVISDESAQLLHESFRADRFYLPTGDRYYRQQAVLARLQAGQRCCEIAKEFGMTVRAIEKTRCRLTLLNESPWPAPNQFA
jgi:hypothetical protein